MITIKHPYTTLRVVTDLMRANPSKKQTESVSIQKWNDYVQLISCAVQKSILLARSEQIDKQQLPLQWNEMNKKLGRSRRFTYLDWFQTHFPLVRILRKGTPGELTMTTLLYEIEIGAASQTPQEAFKTIYSQYLDIIERDSQDPSLNLVDWVPINKLSLQAFIQGNEQKNKTAENAKLRDTLAYNRIWAKSILLCAEFMEQCGLGSCIPQIASESDFGRRYYQGMNLQNCPKTVRHAALGQCYQYDLNASVFAWRYNFVKQIDSSILMPFTLEYIDEKDPRRQQLARALDIPVTQERKINIVKQLITSIGFGSRPGNNGVAWKDQNGSWKYPAINSIIKSPSARAKILAHPWLAGFIEEQKQINKIIFDFVKESLRHLKFLENDRGNLSVNATLAYLYQKEERYCIDLLSQEAKSAGTFLLAVHDGFYTCQPVKLAVLKEKLVRINPYATVSKQSYQAWGYNDQEQQHRQLIIEQEKLANNGFVPAHIMANRARIQKINSYKEYTGHDEFDNGLRLESMYDHELDPFYMNQIN